MKRKKIIIVGAGLAGSMVATQLRHDCDVILITKKQLQNSNSMRAQGGVAVALDVNDSPQKHFADTLQAGCFYNQRDAVNMMVEQGPTLIRQLIAQGMLFDCDSHGNLHYGLEGAHQIARILHCQGDQTGKILTTFFHQKLTDNSIDHPITILENTIVSTLLTQDNQCYGMQIVDQQNQCQTLFADVVVIATGGIGQLYPMTSNDETISGDGIAIAYRAGCQISDMEFMQFHPTLLSINGQSRGLISEAVRGAGAKLVDEQGHFVMQGKHPQRDLAPRDVVSRVLKQAIDKGKKIYLDIANIADFSQKFPAISQHLDEFNIPFRQTHLIPVQPGAHFFMGGITTDLDGQTTIKNLFAVGETACTGVHGANRLASNSLLEIIVFADRVAKKILADELVTTVTAADPNLNLSTHTPIYSHLPDRAELQKQVWHALGIVKSKQKLAEFLAWLAPFMSSAKSISEPVDKSVIECSNLCLVAKLIAESALKREQNIGAHYLVDSN